MFSVAFAVYSIVISFICPKTILLVDATEDSYYEQLLKTYHLCLADARGGIYWEDREVNRIKCWYIWTEGAREVRCEWANAGTVRTTYQVDPNATAPPPRRPNCRLARRVEVGSEAETFTADLDVTAGLPTLIQAPWKFVKWREWVEWTSPLRIWVTLNSSTPLPSLSSFSSLRRFSLSDSPQHFPKHNDIHVFPELPSTIEEISFARNELITIPNNNNSFPSLKRLEFSHNQLGRNLAYSELNFTSLIVTAPALEELDLSHNYIEGIGESLHLLCSTLKWLDLSHNRLNAFTWFYPFNSFTNISLTFLNISYSDKSQPFLFPFRPAFPLLETLDVSYTAPDNSSNTWEITGPNMKRLYASGYDNIRIIGNVSLEYVRMKVTDNKFPDIFNSNIKHLDLSDSKLKLISNMGLKNTSVEYLNISKNEISEWTTENVFRRDEGGPWVKHVNLSYNKIRFMSPNMLRSLQKLESVDLGANPYECNNCTIHTFQTWLKENIDIVFNLNISNTPPYCGTPEEMTHLLISNTDFYQQYCTIDASLLTGVSVGVIGLLLLAQGYVLYHFRYKLIFMYHMYRLRVRQPKDDKRDCTHDVFICYSSVDRLFVMNTLAPFIEEGPEKYKAYIHERSFILGCNIESNIVEAIEKSRHALLVVSEAFLTSVFCKKEFDMVTHRAFDGNQGYMVILRFGPLKTNMLPRPLRLYMTTKTFLEWPQDPTQVQALEVRKRLVNALGMSLYQSAQKEVCEGQTKRKPQPDIIEVSGQMM